MSRTTPPSSLTAARRSAPGRRNASPGRARTAGLLPVAPRVAAAFAALAGAVAALSCGGALAESPAQPQKEAGSAQGSDIAPAPATGRKGADDFEVDTLAEAFVALDQAERRVEVALVAASSETSAQPALEPLPRPAEAPNEAPATPLSQSPTIAERCALACDALRSMRRAAERLCELAGAEDPRCARAEERLGRARSLVQGVCPACDAGR